METLKKYVLPSLVIVASLVVFAIFRIVPAAKLWEGYSVLYVPYEADIGSVENVLYENGIKEFSAKENQSVPLNIALESPEVALSSSTLNPKREYLFERENYFFDKEKDFRLYYVPEKYRGNLSGTVAELKDSLGIVSGVDSKASYPMLSPLVCIIFSLFLVFTSKRKLIMASLLFLPVCFSFFVPLHSSTAAVCLLMHALYLSVRIWGRRDFFVSLLKNIAFSASVVFSVALQFFSGLKCIVLFIVLLASVSCAFILSHRLEDFFERRRYSFVPVLMVGGKFMPIVTKKTGKSLVVLSSSITVLLVLALFSVNMNFFSARSDFSSKKIFLPAAKTYSKSLPDLNDYIDWRWEALVSPYIHLDSSDTGKKKESVSFPTYTNEDGKIKESVKTIAFDRNFRSASFSDIDSLGFPAIEKILKKQRHLVPGFVPLERQRLGLSSVIALVFSLIFPLVLYFSMSESGFKAGSR